VKGGTNFDDLTRKYTIRSSHGIAALLCYLGAILGFDAVAQSASEQIGWRAAAKRKKAKGFRSPDLNRSELWII
jgi:hypothetical protein